MDKLVEELINKSAKGDLNARRRLQIIQDDQFEELYKKAQNGVKEPLKKLQAWIPDLKLRNGDKVAADRLKKIEDLLKKYPKIAEAELTQREEIADNESDLSKMMVKSTALQNFGKNKSSDQVI